MLSVLTAMLIASGSVQPPQYGLAAVHAAKVPRSRNSITIALDPPLNGLELPPVEGPAGRPLVVIDPGHGGHDPGAVTQQAGDAVTREKDVTLALARAMRDELLKGGRVRVALTRGDDRYLILGERSAVARDLRADLLISVHADSAPTQDAAGATIFTLSDVASGETAARLAARENRADVVGGVDVGGVDAQVLSILNELTQRETRWISTRFARLLRREARDGVPFRTDYHQMADFVVLRAPEIPAVLLEAGYLTNSDEALRLTSDAGRTAIAVAVRRAVEIHFARRRPQR